MSRMSEANMFADEARYEEATEREQRTTMARRQYTMSPRSAGWTKLVRAPKPGMTFAQCPTCSQLSQAANLKQFGCCYCRVNETLATAALDAAVAERATDWASIGRHSVITDGDSEPF